MKDDRTAIFARIAEALRHPAPRPKSVAQAQPETERAAGLPVLNDAAGHARWLPTVGESLDERVDLFARNSRELKTDFRTVADRAALADALRELADEEGWRRVATHANGLCDAAVSEIEEGREIVRTDGGYDLAALESCDAGVTACDALVAQTGTVLLTARSAGGRALSVLPPHHVVLATAGQMLGDLPSAYALLHERYGRDWPSWVGLITGPSRTGDIERILVLGAHGPKKLTILLALEEG